jgi:hypothetical protein
MKALRTVFVVGAGASHEFGLPIGDTLKEKIAEVLVPRPLGNSLFHAVAATAESARRTTFAELSAAAAKVARAMPQVVSIDNFLYQRGDDKNIVLAGKIGIAISILAAERRSNITTNQSQGRELFDPSASKNSWINRLVQELGVGCTRSELESRLSQIAFVVFNYDRCIEHFLYWSLINVYDVTPSDAARLVNNVVVLHAYGQVGKFGWAQAVKGNPVAFGEDPHPQQVLDVADQIRTFTESTRPEDTRTHEIRHAIGTAAKIVYLGFSFNEQNVELLYGPPDNEEYDRSEQQVYATTLGMSRDATSRTRTALCNRGHYEPHLSFSSIEGGELMRDFALSLGLR